MDKPWIGEPHHAAFIHLGVACEIRRHPSMGHLCAYVTLPEGHPFLTAVDHWGSTALDVHGGTTYQGGPGGRTFGWDYAHYGDLVPAMSRLHAPETGADVYHTFAKVENDTRDAACQVWRAAPALCVGPYAPAQGEPIVTARDRGERAAMETLYRGL